MKWHPPVHLRLLDAVLLDEVVQVVDLVAAEVPPLLVAPRLQSTAVQRVAAQPAGCMTPLLLLLLLLGCQLHPTCKLLSCQTLPICKHLGRTAAQDTAAAGIFERGDPPLAGAGLSPRTPPHSWSLLAAWTRSPGACVCVCVKESESLCVC